MADEAPRKKLNPRTLALIRAALGDRPVVTEAPPEKPAPPPPVVVATPPPTIPVGATPFLPGLGLGAPSLRSKHRPFAKSPPATALNEGFTKLSNPLSPLRDVIIVDTETTGAGVGARLVEVGAIRVKDAKVVEQFQTLVDPEMHIPSYVTKIHGITDAMVAGAPKVRLVLNAFLEFVGDRPLLAHNAAFDRGILAQELQRATLTSPSIPMFCSLKLARRVFPQAPNHKLSTLAVYLKIPDAPAHRALADCLTTVGVLAACAERHPLHSLHTLHGPASRL